MSGNKSFFNIINLSSNNRKLSPVLDTQRMSAFTITNRLNNPNSGNTPDFVADTASTNPAHTLTSLTNNKSYTFRVAALNDAGTGAYSSSSIAVIPTSS